MKLDEVYIEQELRRIIPHHREGANEENDCWRDCATLFRDTPCDCGAVEQREAIMKLILEVAGGIHEG